jgi:predicted TPR repeat methyltransferase
MLAQAEARHVYDELVRRELTTYLRECQDAFDVIVSADTLVYFGSLAEVTAASANALRRGGQFIFTVEELTDGLSYGDFRLNPHGRYSHARHYLERVLTETGLRPEVFEAELRLEAGVPVAGLVVRARKPAALLSD